ncbi:MAG: tRNA (adenosine(37)-N6)-threonylcarbamoyltransferase complex ATPase subunit type 1 TsaE [Bacillota bacterium]
MELITNDFKKTKSIGRIIAEIIKKDKNLFSQIILLTGDLGAGKTVLVKGIAEGLGIDFEITSPTFNLINEYENNPGLLHMDFYRIDTKEELLDLGIEEYIARNDIKAVEWPQLVFDYISDDFLYIKIKRVSENERKIILKAEGNLSKKIIEGLKTNVDFRN